MLRILLKMRCVSFGSRLALNLQSKATHYRVTKIHLGEAALRLSRAAVLFAIVAGAGASLFADSVTDPLVLFSSGGHHSFDIEVPPCTLGAHGMEVQCLLSDVIDGSGQLSNFDIKNMTGKNIDEIDFIIQTTNFDQTFTANTAEPGLTPIFPFADVSVQPSFFSSTGTVTVKFGDHVPNFPTVVSDIPCDSESCNAGFTPFGSVEILAFFGPDDTGSYKNGEDGILNLEAVPEPATFGLFFGALGLIAGGRKFRSRLS